jgi:hypothetical protein
VAALAAGCDGPVTWVVRRDTLVQPGCPSPTRALVFEYDRRGRRHTARGELLLSSLPENHLLAVFPTISGSPAERGRLTVRCPATGETVHRSGWVQFEKAFCGTGFLAGLVFLDGLPPGATGKRCCPERSSCPLRVHHAHRLLRGDD